MDVNTFFKTVKYIVPTAETRAPSFWITGAHGIGKSSIVKKLARQINLPLIDRRLGQMTEGDMIGLPKVDGEVTRFLPVDFIKQASDKACLLFFDEANRATREVLQSLFQISLDYELNGVKLHPGTRIIIAANEGSQYGVTRIDPALKDRFWKIVLEPTQEEFLEWAKDTDVVDGGNFDGLLWRFLNINRSWIDPPSQEPDAKLKYQSRRAWAMFNKPWIEIQKEEGFNPISESSPWRTITRELAAGFVGDIAAQEFITFVKAYGAFISAEEILSDYDEAYKSIQRIPGEKWNTCIQKVVDYLSKTVMTVNQAKQFKKFVITLPVEHRMNMWSVLASQGGHKNAITTANIRTVHDECRDILVDTIKGKAAGAAP